MEPWIPINTLKDKCSLLALRFFIVEKKNILHMIIIFFTLRKKNGSLENCLLKGSLWNLKCFFCGINVKIHRNL